MTDNLDRIDRRLLANESTSYAPASRRALVPLDRVREPVITSTRGSRFVDHTACPMCGTDGEGVEFHGVLLTGVKVHTIAAHSPAMRRVQNGHPRCLGSSMRMVFEAGSWKGAPL